jgi:hypothetical protein
MSDVRRIDLHAVVSWHDRYGAELASRGVETRLISPTVGRSKDSATVEFISAECLVSATVWDSGESEVITAFVDRDEDPAVSIQNLIDSEAVAALLDHVVVGLVANRNNG